MKVELLGGFGEKGRTSLTVSSNGARILLDCGIKVGASGAEYYPAFADDHPSTLDAVFISHAHEDHVGALSRLLSLGYLGPVFMTSETMQEAPATLAAYADPTDFARFPLPADQIRIFAPGDELRVGSLRISTGCSGHVAGGSWFAVSDGERSLAYAGDVVPDSSVFRMDPLPECDLVALDASYGADPVSGSERAKAIAAWVARHPQGCLLPTPLSGRSLELMAALPEPIAIHKGMRNALRAQIDAESMLTPGAAGLLSSKLARAKDWSEAEALPAMPLLSDDGMGAAGPSSRLIARARRENQPILLTGHLPAGSPADLAHREARADWIRMPTHPTLAGNVTIWEKAGRPAAIGHSCPAADLDGLLRHIPTLKAGCRTGDILEIGGRA